MPSVKPGPARRLAARDGWCYICPVISQINNMAPSIHSSAFVAPGAVVLGAVELGEQVSVWYGCVLRADINWIRIGARSNLQDGTIIHVHYTGQGTQVGQEVSVGHRAVLHSCTVEDRALIGMGAVVLDRALVGVEALVAAGSLVPPGMKVPPATLVAGVPAKVVRQLSPEELQANQAIVKRYLRVTRCHQDPGYSEDFSQG